MSVFLFFHKWHIIIITVKTGSFLCCAARAFAPSRPIRFWVANLCSIFIASSRRFYFAELGCIPHRIDLPVGQVRVQQQRGVQDPAQDHGQRARALWRRSSTPSASQQGARREICERFWVEKRPKNLTGDFLGETSESDVWQKSSQLVPKCLGTSQVKYLKYPRRTGHFSPKRLNQTFHQNRSSSSPRYQNSSKQNKSQKSATNQSQIHKFPAQKIQTIFSFSVIYVSCVFFFFFALEIVAWWCRSRRDQTKSTTRCGTTAAESTTVPQILRNFMLLWRRRRRRHNWFGGIGFLARANNLARKEREKKGWWWFRWRWRWQSPARTEWKCGLCKDLILSQSYKSEIPLCVWVEWE